MTPIETVVTWKWKPRPGYRSKFESEHVNVLRAMVARHYRRPHRFVCVTDDPEGLDPRVEALPIPDLWGNVQNPSWPNGPSCYRRLHMFAADVDQWLGRRFVSMDLDAVVVGDLEPLWDRPEDVVLWSDPLFTPRGMYCGSMVLLTAGAYPRVHDSFDPEDSPRKTHAAGCLGSDQGWISYTLGPRMPCWTTADGVYSFWVHLEGKGQRPPRPPRRDLPHDARVVFFHGRRDPWHADVQDEFPWVREHWRP